MNVRQGFEPDDLLLIPQPSSINSRSEVDLSTDLGSGFILKLPIISAPMSGIVGVELIRELGRLGGLGILHRFYNDVIEREKDVSFLEKAAINFGVAIGLGDNYYRHALNFGATIVLIDVANGYLDSVVEFTENVAGYIKQSGYNCLVMAGNVATFDGAKRLYDAGATLIRVGIGSGQLCVTRQNTGSGVSQATAIQDCSHYLNDIDIYEMGSEHRINPKTPWYTIADGGIKTSGDGTKALALGADFLMIGSLFANAYESDHDGKIQGQASREHQEQFYGEVRKSVEGVQQEATKKMSLEELITEFCWNMRSGFVYSNSTSISDLHKNAKFILCGTESIIQK